MMQVFWVAHFNADIKVHKIMQALLSFLGDSPTPLSYDDLPHSECLGCPLTLRNFTSENRYLCQSLIPNLQDLSTREEISAS